MARPARRKPVATSKRPTAASKKRTPQRSRTARMLIDDVTAILLVSADAKQLCAFYRSALGLPLEAEVHDGITLHYGVSLGDVHFAIHPAKGWRGSRTRNARSPVISFSSSNLKAVRARLSAHGVEVSGPTDHGFGHTLFFRDPDGHPVSIVEYAPEHW